MVYLLLRITLDTSKEIEYSAACDRAERKRVIKLEFLQHIIYHKKLLTKFSTEFYDTDK
jgi:hypothetical protein